MPQDQRPEPSARGVRHVRGGNVLEFEITLGPLHIALRLGNEPAGDIGYLLTETELAEDDADTTETRAIGFRGH